MRRDDNPTHVEAYVGFTLSEDGSWIHSTVTDYKDSMRNKRFAYKVLIPIPQEVLDAAHELEEIEGKVVSKLTFEVIEHEEPIK